MKYIQFICLLLLINTPQINGIVPVADNKPFVRIVAVVDMSGSFQKYTDEALTKVQDLIDTLAARPLTTDQGSNDIMVIRLDAAPEVVYSEKIDQFDSSTPHQLRTLLETRPNTHRDRTDLQAALNLAIYKTHQAPLPALIYILVFSDLVNDVNSVPPKRPVPPPIGIQWAQVDTARTIFFALFTPDSQAMIWRQNLPSGIKMVFKNPAEARSTALVPPNLEPLFIEEKQLELKRIITQSRAWLGKLALWAVWGTLGLVGLVGSLAAIQAFVSRRRA